MSTRRLTKIGLSGLSTPRILNLGKRAIGRFFSAGCLQLSAAIAYHALLSIFPLLIFVVWVGTWFLDDARVREEIVELLTDQIALTPDGEAELAAQLKRVASRAGTAGLLAIPLLVWAASAMMTSVRHGVNVAWGVPSRRQFLRGKLLDLGIVALLGAFAITSIVTTILSRLLPQNVEAIWAILSALIPPVLTFLGVLLVFKILPAVKTYARDVWPAALLAALLLEALKIGFAFYLDSISDNNAIYGSLGAVISFLLFIYLAAAVLLLTAGFAAELPRVRAGLYDNPTQSEGGGLLEEIKDEFRRVAKGRPEEEFRSQAHKGPD